MKKQEALHALEMAHDLVRNVRNEAVSWHDKRPSGAYAGPLEMKPGVSGNPYYGPDSVLEPCDEILKMLENVYGFINLSLADRRKGKGEIEPID